MKAKVKELLDTIVISQGMELNVIQNIDNEGNLPDELGFALKIQNNMFDGTVAST